MKQILIFDYDGVIVDSLSLFMKYFIEACHEHGFSSLADKEQFLQLFHGNMFEQMMQKGMNKKNILAIVYHLKEGLISNQEKINLFPGIKSVLEQLAQNYTLVISTSNETAVVMEYLKKKRLCYLFDDVYGSDIEPSKVKKIYLIQKDNESDNSFYIGDTVGDIKEARQAQTKAVAVTWGWHTKRELIHTNPDYIVDQPSDLLSLFNIKSPLNVDYNQVE